ncbi:MAG: hypothetical protein QXU06_03855 [Candidatus Bathyarchaeia archaeon]
MLELVRALGADVPDRGWQMFRLKRAYEEAARDRAAIVIALDEVDAIIHKERGPLVYYLSRQPKTTLILVSNRIDDAICLPDRALSALRPILLGLEPYGAEWMRAILRERAEMALRPGALPDRLLEAIARAAAEVGDIRAGFAILLSACLIAERAGRDQVRAGDVEEAIRGESSLSLHKGLMELRRDLKAARRRRG